jgi:hypothetical protein
VMMGGGREGGGGASASVVVGSVVLDAAGLGLSRTEEEEVEDKGIAASVRWSSRL